MNSAAFRAVLWKELRQHVKWIVIGFVASALGLAVALAFAEGISMFQGGGSLMSISWMSAFLCGAVGLVIGLAQMVPEARDDDWGFLVHRPITRSMLFMARSGAGKLMYIVGFGVPLTIACLWARGNFAVPFDARMLEPSIIDFLTGFAYYFAGVFAGVRKGHWFGSRALGIAAAIVLSVLVLTVDSFGRALALDLVGIAILSAAAWGTFVAGGEYETQRTPTRFAVTISSALGVWAAAVVVVGLIGIFFVSKDVIAPPPGEQWIVTPDGNMQRVQGKGRTTPAVGSGLVIPLPTTTTPRPRQPRDTAKDTTRASGVVIAPPMTIARNWQSFWQHGYRAAGSVFITLPLPREAVATVVATGDNGTQVATPAAAGIVWYYILKRGLLAKYDSRSSQLLGWLGPDGFSPGPTPPARRFSGEPRASSMQGPFSGMPFAGATSEPRLLALPGVVYRLDLAKDIATLIFVAPAGDTVLAAVQPMLSDRTLLTFGRRAQFQAIATVRGVTLLSGTGGPPLTLPHDSLAKGYGTLTVARALAGANDPILLRYTPDMGTVSWRSPEQVVKYSGTGQLLDHFTLPHRSIVSTASFSSEAVATSFLTPLAFKAYTTLRPTTDTQRSTAMLTPSQGQERATWVIIVIAALASTIGAFLIGRRWAFGPTRLWLWTIIALALGVATIPLMLSLFNKPARELCPSCGQPRVVTEERCPHCGAPFSAPQPDGTEIWETPAAARA